MEMKMKPPLLDTQLAAATGKAPLATKNTIFELMSLRV